MDESGNLVPPDDSDDEAVLGELLEEGDQDAPVARRELREVIATLRSSSSYFSGPLPRPELLAAYNEIIPDGAERIMRLTEKEQDHRHEWERNQQTLVGIVAHQEYGTTSRGQLFGLVVAILIMATGIAFMLVGYPKSGASIIVVDAIGLATTFVVGRARSGSNEIADEPASREEDEPDEPA